ncbi:MAG: hypothetical protein ACD_75C01221G0002 [uncultured bacterium]|nr:MAG: hypothetical protein ACD_75C01221G0002 [uncultured bacterium]
MKQQGVPLLPAARRLRGYAFDPSLSLRLETALINQVVYQVDWERELKPGPVGEYLEVVDFDPASGCWYEPVDLNTNEILAQDGLSPSEGTPQFHQQMVYAVAMTTIRNIENALGRRIFWSSEYDKNKPVGERDIFIQRLRIYPHAFRGANAYYSPTKKALLFGYFSSPTGMVFSCLSHDIIAHETAHALLDGLQWQYIEDNHPDVLAFQEAFADLIALFQHFTFPEVLRHQIARTRGDLTAQSLLGELAQQFGEASGHYGALRSFIGERDESGRWRPIVPSPRRLAEASEPHTRGAILVAAIFNAFLAIYKVRVADLYRLATAGTGVLPNGAIHPDLVERLAREANKTARHFLGICIRAIDYCPIGDITFGDYLRAMITADFDMIPNDQHGYRVALIESFRQWGIIPEGVKTLSEEHLRWPFATDVHPAIMTAIAQNLRAQISESLYHDNRRQSFDFFREAQKKTHEFLRSAARNNPESCQQIEDITGLKLSDIDFRTGKRITDLDRYKGIRIGHESLPTFRVHSIRPALRVNPNGTIMKQMIMTIVQRRCIALDPDNEAKGTFNFWAGSTLIFDLDNLRLRYAIRQRIDSEQRLARVIEHRRSKAADFLALRKTYFKVAPLPAASDEPLPYEPFALLHSDT